MPYDFIGRVRISYPRIAIWGSNLSFRGSLQVKIANQNFLSVDIFVFMETRKFLFTFQTRQIAYILLENVLNCTQFSYIWIAFWPPPYPLTVETSP